MVSRETRVHVVAVALALGILAVSSSLVSGISDPIYLVAILAYNALIFGGAHLYLAWRGEGGTVPVSSRWRFLAMLAVLLGLGVVGALGPDPVVGDVPFDSVLFVLGGLVVIIYVVLEAREGYRDSRPS